MIEDLLKKNRTYRRFDGNFKIEKSLLEEVVSLYRYCSSGANAQPLKFLITADEKANNEVFKNLAWAGYLANWNGPKEEERPTAYIVILGDKNISSNFYWDHGLVAQSFLLALVEQGLGGCMFAAVNKEGIQKAFHLSEHLEILMVIAIGKPIEEVVLEEMKNPTDFKYWRDENLVHHVPKRTLEDVLIDIKL